MFFTIHVQQQKESERTSLVTSCSGPYRDSGIEGVGRQHIQRGVSLPSVAKNLPSLAN